MSLKTKLLISVASAAVFVLVNLPQVYKFTDSVLGKLVGPLVQGNGCATTLGAIIHAVVFYLLTRFMMKNDYATCEATKHRRALTATLIFVLLSSPLAYRMVRSVLGGVVASSAGCPTFKGIFVHAGVYAAILLLLMRR